MNTFYRARRTLTGSAVSSAGRSLVRPSQSAGRTCWWWRAAWGSDSAELLHIWTWCWAEGHQRSQSGTRCWGPAGSELRLPPVVPLVWSEHWAVDPVVKDHNEIKKDLITGNKSNMVKGYETEALQDSWLWWRSWQTALTSCYRRTSTSSLRKEKS